APGSPYIGCADGPTERARTATRAWHERALLDRLRERRVVDLLRARPGGLLRARADTDRVRDHRGDLLPHGRHLRRGHRDVPGGGRLLELRPPRLQRAVVAPRCLGAVSQLHDYIPPI